MRKLNVKFMLESGFAIEITTRYAETDQMGYIHHGVYPQYLEQARIEWMKLFGISYKSLEINGILLPVRNMHIRYIIPLTFDEKITVRIIRGNLKGPRLIFEYEIYNEAGKKSTEAEVELFFADADGRPIRPPQDLVAKLQR